MYAPHIHFRFYDLSYSMHGIFNLFFRFFSAIGAPTGAEWLENWVPGLPVLLPRVARF